MRDGPYWVAGIITELHGPVSFIVRLSNGDEWRRHIDQLRDRDAKAPVPLVTTKNDLTISDYPSMEPADPLSLEKPLSPPSKRYHP